MKAKMGQPDNRSMTKMAAATSPWPIPNDGSKTARIKSGTPPTTKLSRTIEAA
jgi:hypothetical protein